MKIEEFTNLMNILGTAYGKEFDQRQVGVWYDFFKDASAYNFKIAIKRIIATSKYLPSIAEVKEELAKQELGNLQLDVEEEWSKVRYWMRNYREDKKEEVIAEFGPLTTRVIESMGWERVLQQLNSSEVGVEHNRFKQIFMSLQGTYSNTSVLNPTIRNLVESKRMEQLTDDDKDFINGSIYLN